MQSQCQCPSTFKCLCRCRSTSQCHYKYSCQRPSHSTSPWDGPSAAEDLWKVLPHHSSSPRHWTNRNPTHPNSQRLLSRMIPKAPQSSCHANAPEPTPTDHNASQTPSRTIARGQRELPRGLTTAESGQEVPQDRGHGLARGMGGAIPRLPGRTEKSRKAARDV